MKLNTPNVKPRLWHNFIRKTRSNLNPSSSINHSEYLSLFAKITYTKALEWIKKYSKESSLIGKHFIQSKRISKTSDERWNYLSATHLFPIEKKINDKYNTTSFQSIFLEKGKSFSRRLENTWQLRKFYSIRFRLGNDQSWM